MCGHIRHFGRYLRDHQIRIVHAFDVPTSIFAAPAAALYRTPVILTSMLGHRDAFPRPEQILLSFSDHFADRIVVNSQAVQRHLIGRGLPQEKLFVAHNGYQPGFFYPPSGPRPRPAALADATAVVGCVCVMRPEKNIALLIEAFAKAKTPGAKLLLVGSGPMRDPWMKLAAQLLAPSDYHFEPGRPDVEAVFQSIDIFVLPSSTESFPNALLEAMASGCASIASRVGGIPELITEGQTGFLFEPGNGEALTALLSRLLGNPGLVRQTGERAAAHVKDNFSMEVYCHRLEQFYRTLLEA